MLRMILVSVMLVTSSVAYAQTAPSAPEIAAYQGLLRAAQIGDAAEIGRLVAAGADVNVRDRNGRTPAHVAAFFSSEAALRALAAAGADMNALENQAYDVVTIAAVANDPDLMSLAIALGNDPRLITSPYNGTALIAATHLGHAEMAANIGGLSVAERNHQTGADTADGLGGRHDGLRAAERLAHGPAASFVPYRAMFQLAILPDHRALAVGLHGSGAAQRGNHPCGKLAAQLPEFGHERKEIRLVTSGKRIPDNGQCHCDTQRRLAARTSLMPALFHIQFVLAHIDERHQYLPKARSDDRNMKNEKPVFRVPAAMFKIIHTHLFYAN